MNNVNLLTDTDTAIIINFKDFVKFCLLVKKTPQKTHVILFKLQADSLYTGAQHSGICCALSKTNFTLTHGWADMFSPEMQPLAIDLF